MSEMRPFERKATPELVAEHLRQAIMVGNLRPGQRLSEAALSEQFGLGRGTIREAMQRLIQEGLVNSQLHRGVFVTTLGDDDITDIYFARSAAEIAATRLLTLRKDEETFALLDDVVESMRGYAGEGDWLGFADVDVQFHETIVRRTNSKRLWRMYQTLITETRMCLNPGEREYPRSPDLVGQHNEILVAMRSGDLDLVERKVSRHLKDASIRLAGQISDYFELDSTP